MQKTVIALFGKSAQGKSTIICRVSELILDRLPNAEFQSIEDVPNEVTAIIIVGTLRIAIRSMGDPGTNLDEAIQDFVGRGCEIIICATRTRGETTDSVSDLSSNGYDIIWASPYISYEVSHDYLNRMYAIHICELIEDLINGEVA